MSIRLVTITGMAIDGAGIPNTAGAVSLHLLVPGNGLAIHTATGDLINRDPDDPTVDPTTAAWSNGVVAPGDITPSGCEWQVAQGPGQPIVSDSFAYTASTINVTSWISSPSRFGMMKMFLTAITGSGLADTGATFGVTINTDSEWAGTGGSGQLIQAGAPPIVTVVDSAGQVFYYLVPQSALNPSDGYYQTPTRKQTLYFTVPNTYTDADLGVTDNGVYASGTTYAANAIVRDPANNYEPYISLAGGNVGNTPSSSPSHWADYVGVEITLFETVPEVPGTRALTQVGIAADTSVLTGSFTLPAATLQDELRQRFQADIRNAGAWSNTTAYLLNDAVQLTGSWYVCILAHTGHTPPNVTYWAPLGSGGGGTDTQALVSAAYTVLTTDRYVEVDCTGAGRTITLPDAATYPTGKILSVKKWDGTPGSNAVTMATTSSQHIDAYASGALTWNTQGQAYSVMSNGSNWRLV